MKWAHVLTGEKERCLRDNEEQGSVSNYLGVEYQSKR